MSARRSGMAIAAAVALAALLVVPREAAGAAPVKIKNKIKKDEAVAAVETHKAEIVALSDQVWGFAETALLEARSAEALAAYAEKQGFKVERGLAGMPTAFVASYGEGRPVIGILGEYDALPGLSQKAQASKEVLEAGAPGHGCGHNLLGTAALSAALAVKDLMAAGKLKGTVRFYGTPAEEAVGGKVYMVRDGIFKDLDVCLTWHPSDKTAVAVDGSQAIIDFIVEFTRPDRPRGGRSLERPQRRGRPGALHRRASTACANSSGPPCACTTRSSTAATSPTSSRPTPGSGAGSATRRAPGSSSCSSGPARSPRAPP